MMLIVNTQISFLFQGKVEKNIYLIKTPVTMPHIVRNESQNYIIFNLENSSDFRLFIEEIFHLFDPLIDAFFNRFVTIHNLSNHE